MNAIHAALPLALFPRNRARRVGPVTRAASCAFGSPSFLRANGFSETGPLSGLAARLRRRRTREVPVYQVDRRGTWADERLPRIWVSEPDCDAAGEPTGKRRMTHRYPCGPDRRGERALELAEGMFAEGLIARGEDRSIACFQAAEILYLHAAARGNVEACTRLGALYRHDLCAGMYWRDSISAYAKHVKEDVLAKAVRMFSRAAARGSAEAKWQLGDMRLEGEGCDADCALAWNLYRGSFCRAAGCDLAALDAAADEAAILSLVSGEGASLEDCGCAAVRMAICLEHGMGIQADPQRARAWYSAAVRLLDSCVGAGSWLYEKELASASEGMMRAPYRESDGDEEA